MGAEDGDADGAGDGGTALTTVVERAEVEIPTPLASIVALVAAVPPEYLKMTGVPDSVIVVGEIVNVPVVSESVRMIG
jgi:hypothetical protein